jgi:serine phosphatase RsbU (regulator of sigma subunit)
LLNEIKDNTLKQQKERLEAELKNHMQKEEQRDDITFIGLKLI